MNLKRSRTEEANQAPMSRTHAFQFLAVNISEFWHVAQVLGNKAHTQPVSEGKKSEITDFKGNANCPQWDCFQTQTTMAGEIF